MRNYIYTDMQVARQPRPLNQARLLVAMPPFHKRTSHRDFLVNKSQKKHRATASGSNQFMLLNIEDDEVVQAHMPSG